MPKAKKSLSPGEVAVLESGRDKIQSAVHQLEETPSDFDAYVGFFHQVKEVMRDMVPFAHIHYMAQLKAEDSANICCFNYFSLFNCREKYTEKGAEEKLFIDEITSIPFQNLQSSLKELFNKQPAIKDLQLTINLKDIRSDISGKGEFSVKSFDAVTLNFDRPPNWSCYVEIGSKPTRTTDSAEEKDAVAMSKNETYKIIFADNTYVKFHTLDVENLSEIRKGFTEFVKAPEDKSSATLRLG